MTLKVGYCQHAADQQHADNGTGYWNILFVDDIFLLFKRKNSVETGK